MYNCLDTIPASVTRMERRTNRHIAMVSCGKNEWRQSYTVSRISRKKTVCRLQWCTGCA